LAVLGSTVAVLTFLTTLSFLISLPGWEPKLGGFPALSGTGGFLIKDFVLLGTALWTLGESWAAMNIKSSPADARPHQKLFANRR
jgi:uncharacterized membrane protein YkgB